jgi:hypothetical protein
VGHVRQREAGRCVTRWNGACWRTRRDTRQFAPRRKSWEWGALHRGLDLNSQEIILPVRSVYITEDEQVIMRSKEQGSS